MKFKRNRKKLIVLLVTTLIVFMGNYGCEKTAQPNVFSRTENIDAAGGITTISDFSPTAFSQVNPALKGKDELDFFVGDSFFNQNWVAAPASTKARDGLGPLLNARSCSGCHNKDGKGLPILQSGASSQGFLMRISIPGETKNGAPKPHPLYGDQWQDQGIGQYKEGSIDVFFTDKKFQYPDGTTVTLRVPHYKLIAENGKEIENLLTSPRVAQHLIGMGLIEAIAEQDIRMYENNEITRKWGVSGRTNRVFNEVTKQFELGRFGWKAGQPNVAQQVAAAFKGDMGITSPIYPTDNQTEQQVLLSNLPDGGTPEIEPNNFDKIVLYTSNLAVPARRNSDQVQNGSQLFSKIGCDVCHRPSYTTGTHPRFSSLSKQKIYPYSDFLLHDMGPKLADHRPEFEANGSEWRTPPLWGVGLVETVNQHTYFLHDGRARNIEEAILWHGGEAQQSIDAFTSLSSEARQSVIEFVKSL